MADEHKKFLEKNSALPTQKFVSVSGVENGTIVLKHGGLRKIVMVSGINFDLKSEDEQEMVTSAFQNFLNALDFTIQIFIHSRKLNIDSYITQLTAREAKESNGLLKNQISEYREFIRAFVNENEIMSKTYFVVVPYEPIKLPEGSEAVTKKIFGFLKRRGVDKPTGRITGAHEDEQVKARHIEQLSHRVDQIVNGLNQIGLRAVPLNDDELLDLLYNLYNPDAVERRDVTVEQ